MVTVTVSVAVTPVDVAYWRHHVPLPADGEHDEPLPGVYVDGIGTSSSTQCPL